MGAHTKRAFYIQGSAKMNETHEAREKHIIRSTLFNQNAHRSPPKIQSQNNFSTKNQVHTHVVVYFFIILGVVLPHVVVCRAYHSTTTYSIEVAYEYERDVLCGY